MSGETHTAATWGELVTLIPRLRAAEKVIEAAREVRKLSGCHTWSDDDDQCQTHGFALPCPVGAIYAAIADYDEQAGQ